MKKDHTKKFVFYPTNHAWGYLKFFLTYKVGNVT